MNILNRNEISQISGGIDLNCTIALDNKAPVKVTHPNKGVFLKYLGLFCDAGLAKSITYSCKISAKPFYGWDSPEPIGPATNNYFFGEHNCE